MTRGEMVKITKALHNIAIVEERVNDVTVWSAMEKVGVNGMRVVEDLKDAMYDLTSVVFDDLKHGIHLRQQTEKIEA